MNHDLFYRKVDNSTLILFRIFFGIFIMFECWGAIFTGWVNTNFVEPQLNFSFIGFEWTHVFLGQGMVTLYGVMGFLGLLIATGTLYRVSSIAFALLWMLTYLMQKTSYNNHYYLFMLVSWAMAFMPAHRFFSVDSTIFPKIKATKCSVWIYYFFILQLSIVYFFAAINKIYPDWFNGQFLLPTFERIGGFIKHQYNFDILGDFVASRSFAQGIAWIGFLFDLLIVPIMLIPKLRKYGLILSFVFHLSNSIIFQIGIFPYFSLGMLIFFYPSDFFQEKLFPKKSFLLDRLPEDDRLTMFRVVFKYFFVLYFMWQIYLPIRHHFISENVFWTEEGHRMSWRMMLRSKAGHTSFYTLDKTGKKEQVFITNYLTNKQILKMAYSPDMIWQFAHILKGKLDPTGEKGIRVYVDSRVSVNGSDFYPFIDPTVDLASTKWHYFSHQPWILPQPKELHLSFFE
ncbi:HTTM domain-containing protein [Vaginella massiliensis]|uniref:HTTM domain-containing protein n=1 Tax=Vaginella massiliensis TaxID=1816680 RepID=UPI00083947C3|nr:HTTM domain-containing protein [Vaginella massiliensis]